MGVHLIIGPMFSGKTTELVNRAQQRTDAILVKPSVDTRYSNDRIQTHDGTSLKSLSINYLTRSKLPETYPLYIDEGHLFPDCIEFVNQRMLKQDITISTLNATYEQQTISIVSELLPYVETINYKTALCDMCHQTAQCTIKHPDTDKIIGGKSVYMASCLKCMQKFKAFFE